jgi:hypothetical protein
LKSVLLSLLCIIQHASHLVFISIFHVVFSGVKTSPIARMDIPSPPKNKVDKFGVPKKVHYVAIGNMVPALALCIAHGAVTDHVAPALGLIPAGLGAILAVYRSGLLRLVKPTSEHEYQILLSNDREDREKHRFGVEAVLLAFADLAFAAGLITTIVFSFLVNNVKCHYSWYRYEGRYRSSQWCNDSGLPMLAAYGTFPLLLATAIHLFLILHFCYCTLPKLWGKKKKSGGPVCSRCHVPIREGGKYQDNHDDTPAPSMDSMA